MLSAVSVSAQQAVVRRGSCRSSCCVSATQFGHELYHQYLSSPVLFRIADRCCKRNFYWSILPGLLTSHDPARGSGQDVSENSRVESSPGKEAFEISRVGSERVMNCANITGRAGSPPDDPIPFPASSDLTRVKRADFFPLEVPKEFYEPKSSEMTCHFLVLQYYLFEFELLLLLYGRTFDLYRKGMHLRYIVGGQK